MRMNTNYKLKSVITAWILTAAMIVSVFISPIGAAITARAASVNPSDYGLPGTVSATGESVDNVRVSAGISMGTGIAGSSVDSTYQYTVGGAGPAMCINPSMGGPQGRTGPEAQFYSAVTPFTANSGQQNWAGALSDLTISQMVVGGLNYAGSNSSRWTFVHALLSYVLGGDRSWINAYTSTAGETAVYGMAAQLSNTARSVSATAPFWVFHINGKQTLVTLLRGTPEVTTGLVRLNKVDQNGNGVVGAEITFTCETAEGASGLDPQGAYTSVDNGIRFTTTGSVYEIRGLKPNCTYTFTEISKPDNYEWANPRSVSFSTDRNGNPSVSGQANWNSSTYTYNMTDNEILRGSVSFLKVARDSEGNISKLSNAIIEFRSSDGLDLSEADVSMGSGTLLEHDSVHIRFVTGDGNPDSVDIEIGNLEPGQYYFMEVGTPDGYGTAQNQRITVSSDGSCSPSTVTMVDDEVVIPAGNYGSFSLVKVFDPGVDGTISGPNGFFNSVRQIDFRMQGPFSEDYIENNPGNLNPDNGNTMYGAAEFATAGNTGTNAVWNSELNRYEFPVRWTLWGQGGFEGVDIDYHYHYIANEDRWVRWDDNAASYIVGLPRNSYFLVTESWNEGYLSDEVNQVFIDSANLSPYWVEMPSESGVRRYVMLFYIGADGVTYICDWDFNGMRNRTAQRLELLDGHDVSIYQDHFESSVENGSRTGILELTKTDETGNGVEGIRFELHRAGTGSGYVIANGHISDIRPSSVNSEGYNEYPVDWDFTMTTYDDNRVWIEYDDPRLVSWDPITGGVYSYGEITGQWEYTNHYITDSGFVYNLSYGDYYIYEFIEDASGESLIGNYRVPDGWEVYDSDFDGVYDCFRKLVTIDSSNRNEPLHVHISNREYALSIEVTKVDERYPDIALSGYSGSTDAAFDLYYDANNNHIVDSVDIYIGSQSDSDRDGICKFHYLFNSLPDGVPDKPEDYPTGFLIVETSAPDGYYLNDTPVSVVLSPVTSYTASVSCVDTPYIELSFGIDKYDEWTDSLLEGYEGDYDATFEIWVDVDGNRQLDEGTDRLLDTVADTDRNGHVDITYVLSPEVISERFPECYAYGSLISCQSVKNYPTQYLVREITAPFDFYLNETVYPICLSGGMIAETAPGTIIRNTPYSSRLKVYKTDGESGADIDNAVFTVYSDVDGNGAYTDGIDTVARTFINGVLTDAGMIWNMAEHCYVSSDLRSGRYILVETGLPDGYFYVSREGTPTLARNEYAFEIFAEDTSVSGFTVRDYEDTEYNIAPHIHTSLTDPLTSSRTAHVDRSVELVDTVSFYNLVPGQEYVMTGTLMLKQSGEPLTDDTGNPITASAVFVPDAPVGTVDVVFELDTQRIMELVAEGVILAPVDIVSFERLQFNVQDDVTDFHQWYDDEPVALHEDINDLGQTVRIGEIRTGVYDNQTLSQVASEGPDSDGYAVIIDNVYYEGLQPGRTYRMEGQMHMLNYDADGNPYDGGTVTGADSREILDPSVEFTPEDHEGYVQVTYVININRFRGKTLVSFEDCYQDDVRVMWHRDITDLPQTLFIPDVHTNAYCADTTPGEMGRTVIGLSQRARIVDEVNYSNLLTDGRRYMVQGSLYWMFTDENGCVHSGPLSDVIGESFSTSTVVFTPEESDGTIQMNFVFDSTVLSGLHYDRLVVCETIYANGGIGWKAIAHHWDFSYENNSQSIYVPDVHTTASTDSGRILYENESCVVTDRVYYENLVPGAEYTVRGSVHYVKTDSEGNITETGPLVQNGAEAVSSLTFIPTESQGFVDLSFTVNSYQLSDVEKLVVFEEVYAGPGIRIALHADINDEEQTVRPCSLSSYARGSDGSRSIASAESVAVIDTVYYSGLMPGHEYRMETDLMNASTGESDSHVSTVFVPDASSGSMDITIRFDASSYTYEKLVVFETVFDNENGNIIKSHCDWNEKSQTISFIPQTGIRYTPVYRYAALGTFMVNIGVFAFWFLLTKRRIVE